MRLAPILTCNLIEIAKDKYGMQTMPRYHLELERDGLFPLQTEYATSMHKQQT